MRHRDVGAALAALALLLAPGLASAQAILHPNQVQVSLVFTNVNPEIRTILDTPVAGTYTWSEYGGSVAPAPPLGAQAYAHGTSRASVDSELTVESSDAGIAYDVVLKGFKGSSDTLFYKTRTIRTLPIQVEPGADGIADFLECAGLLRLRLLDAGGAPVVATGGTIEARLIEPGDPLHGLVQACDRIADGSTTVSLLVRGDSTFDVTARFTVGTDPYSDMVTHEIKLRVFVPCDAVAAVDGTCSGGAGGGAFAFSRIVGEADVLGEAENAEILGNAFTERTSIRATSGPWGNYRYDSILETPASGSYELENLVPSTVTAPSDPYDLRCEFSLRSGRRLEDLELDQLRVHVPDGVTLDLADTCVIDPGFIEGDILLAGPPAPPPPLVAPLGVLLRAGDAPRPLPLDGLVHSSELNSRSHVSSELRSDLRPGESTFLPGVAAASFEGELDPVSGELAGHHELVVGGFHRGATTAGATRLDLVFNSVATPDVWPSYLFGSLGVEEQRAGTRLEPGDVLDDPIRQCHSTIMMSFLSTGVPFVSPRLALPWNWRWSGIDFEGRRRTREVSLLVYGTPIPASAAETTGLVVASLPEGRYTLLPSVQSRNPSGGSTLTDILPVDVKVGCREIIGIYPDFVLGMSPLPPCTESGTVTLSGQVTGDAPVARITWQVNGGPVQTSCTACGVEPTFSLPVTMLNEDATVIVTAEAVDGRVATRTAFSRFSFEPSAPDRRPGSAPLLVSKSGDGLALTWESYGASEASVYRGTLSSLHSARTYDHAGFGACNVLGGTITLGAADVPGTHYFLIGSPCGWGDSSLGRDSFGLEHPPALLRCID